MSFIFIVMAAGFFGKINALYQIPSQKATQKKDFNCVAHPTG
jgi:hypothetical protein